jgi:hypothetical protein
MGDILPRSASGHIATNNPKDKNKITSKSLFIVCIRGNSSHLLIDNTFFDENIINNKNSIFKAGTKAKKNQRYGFWFFFFAIQDIISPRITNNKKIFVTLICIFYLSAFGAIADIKEHVIYQHRYHSIP